MTHATSGPEWRTPFAFYDPDESCWRTSQATFLSGSDLYSETWPRSGMTRAGFAYELPMPALPTVAPASSSLLPTPDTGESPNGHGRRGGRPGNGHQSGASLEQIASLLPTPNAANAGSDMTLTCSGDGRTTPNKLGWAVSLLPTPTSRDHKGANQRGDTTCLHGALLATPNARDYKGSPSAAWEGQASLPRDVERLSRGESTSPPSVAGSASSDDQLPGQLSLDDPPSD